MSGPAVDLTLLLELAANATASTTVQLVDGWVLRAAPDLPFRRSNCVLTSGPSRRASDGDVERKLAIAEAFYAARATVARFQIDPTSGPADLDQRLAGRGYTVEAPVEVLVAPTSAVLARLGAEHGAARAAIEVSVADRLDESWATAYGAAHPDDEARFVERLAAYGRMLRGIGPPSVVVVASIDGRPAGVAFGVLERGWLGVYGMGTARAVRGQGVGTAVLRELAAAAERAGTLDLYLQVEVDNEAAQRLYRGAGFLRAFGYHYRTAPAVADG